MTTRRKPREWWLWVYKSDGSGSVTGFHPPKYPSMGEFYDPVDPGPDREFVHVREVPRPRKRSKGGKK